MPRSEGKQVHVAYSPTNYTAAAPQSAEEHFAGLDNKLALLPLSAVIVCTLDGSVPGSGERFCSIGSKTNTVVGIPTAFTTLIDLRVEVGVIDASRAYEIQLVADPAGTPVDVSGAKVTLPVSTRKASVVLNLPISLNSFGIKVVRTSGTGSSTFSAAQITIGLR